MLTTNFRSPIWPVNAGCPLWANEQKYIAIGIIKKHNNLETNHLVAAQLLCSDIISESVGALEWFVISVNTIKVIIVIIMLKSKNYTYTRTGDYLCV